MARSALEDQVGALGQHRGSGVKEAQDPPPPLLSQAAGGAEVHVMEVAGRSSPRTPSSALLAVLADE